MLLRSRTAGRSGIMPRAAAAFVGFTRICARFDAAIGSGSLKYSVFCSPDL